MSVRVRGFDGEYPLSVEMVDQTTRWNDLFFIQAIGQTTLTADAVVGGSPAWNRTISVASVANISIGDTLGVFLSSQDSPRYWFTEVESISSLDVTLKTMVPYVFPSGSNVVSATKDMNVDGSTTPQIFSIFGGADLSIDITRIMLIAMTEETVSLAKFCDIAGGLARPFYLRAKENGYYDTKIQIYNNADFALFAYDLGVFQAINPAQGQNGMNWRFSLNGDDKHGAVSRVIGGANALQWVVQSDLTDITSLFSSGAYHEVD